LHALVIPPIAFLRRRSGGGIDAGSTWEVVRRAQLGMADSRQRPIGDDDHDFPQVKPDLRDEVTFHTCFFLTAVDLAEVIGCLLQPAVTARIQSSLCAQWEKAKDSTGNV